MNYSTKCLIGLIVFVASSSNLLARQNPTLKFMGRIIDVEKKDNYDKIIIYYNTNDWFSESGHVSITEKINNDGSFKFNLPDLHKPYIISMAIMAKGTFSPKKLWSSYYYVESKDNVKLQIFLNKDYAIFSGIGSAKYNLVTELNNQFWNKYYTQLEPIRIGSGKVQNIADLDSKMKKLVELLEVCNEIKASILDSAKVSPEMKSLLNKEYARYYEEWRFRTELICNANPSYRKHAFDIYKKYEKVFFIEPDSLSTISQSYLDNLSLRDGLEQSVNSQSDNVNVVAFYNYTKNNYKGVLRDRLISLCFFKGSIIGRFAPYKQFLMDSLLIDASRLVKVPYVKVAIVHQLTKMDKFREGKNIYESEFIRVDGKKFDFKLLRGKVILIDVWFNGCTGCAETHAMFKQDLYPRYKDNKEFVLVSINMDQTMERFRAGIKSGLYNSEGDINVWTGSGIDHPFMKYYSIIGAPFLILVDSNGKICYKPDPGTNSIQDLIAHIDIALNSKITSLHN